MSLTKYLRTYLISLVDLKKLDHKVSITDREQNPIVSLTTVPKRIPLLKPTLISLLKQTCLPKEIQINLGKNLFLDQKLPDFLLDLKTIKVYWEDKDCGPATKYIPTLERYQSTEQLIVICDDDMYYPSNLIESLVSAEKSSTTKSSFCINGFKVPASLESKNIPSDKAIKEGKKQIAVIEGCGGYTLRPSFVRTEDLRNLHQAPARALFDDDIWLSGHLSRNNISKFQIPSGKRKSLVNTIETAISGDRKILQTEVMQHFRTDWKPEEIE